MATTPPTTGSVTAFDATTGLGTATGADGTAYPFHCTAIADGTRTIDVGTEVVFDVTAAHGGRWEARGLVRPGLPNPLPAALPT